MGAKSVSVCKNADGTVTVTTEKRRVVVDVRTKTPEEKIEAVRWAVLSDGHVYTSKIEKKVLKILGVYG